MRWNSLNAAALLLGACLLAAMPIRAAGLPPPDSGDFTVRDFRFGTGETLPELRLHYRTLGRIRRNAAGRASNAVLILHGTTGSGAQFLSQNFAGVLFGPGQLLDVSRYFIVLPDGIGHGESSKPSGGLKARFPRYDYDDMVRAQYRILTEKLGVDHVLLVIGTSMGGMHTWVWGEKYPDFIDGLVPLASLPTAIVGRNRMMRRMIIDDIRTDPEWNRGDYTFEPRGLRTAMQVLLFMISSPLQWQKAAPTREAADRFLEEQMASRLNGADANDVLYAFDASRNYDPESDLGKIRAPLVAINSADDQINPPELGILERLVKKVPRGHCVILPISDDTRGHGTHSYPAVWGKYLEELLESIEPRR